MFSNLHCVVTLMGHRISLIVLFSLKFRLYNKIKNEERIMIIEK